MYVRACVRSLEQWLLAMCILALLRVSIRKEAFMLYRLINRQQQTVSLEYLSTWAELTIGSALAGLLATKSADISKYIYIELSKLQSLRKWPGYSAGYMFFVSRYIRVTILFIPGTRLAFCSCHRYSLSPSCPQPITLDIRSKGRIEGGLGEEAR